MWLIFFFVFCSGQQFENYLRVRQDENITLALFSRECATLGFGGNLKLDLKIFPMTHRDSFKAFIQTREEFLQTLDSTNLDPIFENARYIFAFRIYRDLLEETFDSSRDMYVSICSNNLFLSRVRVNYIFRSDEKIPAIHVVRMENNIPFILIILLLCLIIFVVRIRITRNFF